MATTNLQQWNPTAANQETDAEYAADSQRANGATNPSVFDATLANKLYYQLTTFMTALFTAFANKGFATSDANFAALTAQCANLLTTADVRAACITVPYSPVVTLNASVANGFYVPLTGSVTSVVLSGTPTGPITVAFAQDSVGSRNVAFSSTFKTPGTVNLAAGAVSLQTFLQLPDGFLYPTGPMVVV